MFYLQFGGSSFDEATDDLLHPLGVPHVDRRFLKLRHLHGDTDRQTEVTAEQAASPHRKSLQRSMGRPQLNGEPALIGPSRTVLACRPALWHGSKRGLGGFNLAPCEACPC